MSGDPGVPADLRVDDPLDEAPPEDREVLRAALAELTRVVGAVPLPEIEHSEELGFVLVWRLPEGVIEFTGRGGLFSWWTDGVLFSEHDAHALNTGHCVFPEPDSPEALFGGTLVPRFRTWLARHEELERLRDRILKELAKATDSKAFLRHLMGSVTKKLGGG